MKTAGSPPSSTSSGKIGQLKISELRAYAETELGEEFDVRAFHDAVLGSGSMPLDLLEEQMKTWVATQ